MQLLNEFLLLLDRDLLLLLLQQRTDQELLRRLFFRLLRFNQFAQCLIQCVQDIPDSRWVLCGLLLHLWRLLLLRLLLLLNHIHAQAVVVLHRIVVLGVGRIGLVSKHVVMRALEGRLLLRVLIRVETRILLLLSWLLLIEVSWLVLLHSVISAIIIVVVVGVASVRRIVFLLDIHGLIRFEVERARVHWFLCAAKVAGERIVELFLSSVVMLCRLLFVVVRCADSTALRGTRVGLLRLLLDLLLLE